MKMIGRWIIATLFGMALLCSSFATESQALSTESHSGPVDVRVELSPEAPLMGDPLLLKVEVRADQGIEVLMPEFGEALDRFRIVNFFPREEIDPDGRTLYSQHYTLQAPVSGSHTIPSILIEFVDMRTGQSTAPDDQDAYEILTEGLPFEVTSVMPKSAITELHPPLGRLEKPRSRKTLFFAWGIGILLLVGITASLAWYFWKRDIKANAWEIARKELDALLLAPRPSAQDIGPFFVALSDIIRHYLENQFSLRSPELTTERFLELVVDSPDLSRTHQGLLRNFLSQCDLVKFAGHIPTPEAIDEVANAARLFLDETRETTDLQENASNQNTPRSAEVNQA